MTTYLADIFPKIQRFSEKLDNLTLLTDQHWVSIDNILTNKTVYIFRPDNTLLVATDGRVEKAKWEYLGNKSLLVDKADGSFLFKHGFFDQNILALKLDSKNEYAVFVNETKYNGELDSIDKIQNFLEREYLNNVNKDQVEHTTGINFENTERAVMLVKTPEQEEKEKQELEEARKSNKVLEEISKWFLIITVIIIVLALIYTA
jgi:hypothetical protein